MYEHVQFLLETANFGVRLQHPRARQDRQLTRQARQDLQHPRARQVRDRQVLDLIQHRIRNPRASERVPFRLLLVVFCFRSVFCFVFNVFCLF